MILGRYRLGPLPLDDLEQLAPSPAGPGREGGGVPAGWEPRAPRSTGLAVGEDGLQREGQGPPGPVAGGEEPTPWPRGPRVTAVEASGQGPADGQSRGGERFGGKNKILEEERGEICSI
jgi:hypothetical protein